MILLQFYYVTATALLTPVLCSIFQYDQYKTPMENIGLQDSLLSRFDLLFIVLDQVNTAVSSTKLGTWTIYNSHLCMKWLGPVITRSPLVYILNTKWTLLQMDPEQDRKISDFVLRMHRYRATGEQDGDGELDFYSLHYLNNRNLE